MQSSSSYPTPSSDTHVSPDNSLQSSFPDVVRSQQQQELAPNPMPYPAWLFVHGQWVPYQIWAILLSTGALHPVVMQTPMVSPEVRRTTTFSDMHVPPDNSLQSFFPDVLRSQQQQELAPTPMWYSAWLYVHGQWVPYQIWAILLSTGALFPVVIQTPMVSPEHFQSSSAQSSTLQGAFGTVGPRDDASYLPDGAENADVFMPPNAPPVLHAQPHTLHQVGQEHAPPFNPPPHDDGLPSSHDAVQAGGPIGTFEHSHVNPNHFGALGSRGGTGFFGSHQSLSPLSNVVLPANAAVATGSSVTTLVTANVPAIQGPLQVQPSGDLRPWSSGRCPSHYRDVPHHACPVRCLQFYADPRMYSEALSRGASWIPSRELISVI
ncbi:hypothetical protein EDC04DRAFT_2902106 [Pisolithus marmoratus]|nr:hypothetical protein EDC04DRAFT_2902106 [Pisolithus marmoratus]